jgi:ABC-2 type transport system ATP-binding protein
VSVIEAQDVRKTYRRRRQPPKPALDGLNLTVDAGGVHGFLGPNGSGKTTTLRCLLGLASSDSGELRLFDRPVPRELPAVIGDVGALLESPAFFPPYSGRLNLRLLATAASLPMTRVDEVLETVGLTDAADERVKGYSLGMRQRLGIATALIGEPDVLILDEPANGLDPAGIRWMRGLLRDYADQGGTVLLSSHLLHEIEVIADDLIVIGNGRIMAQGAKKDLLQTAGSFVRVSERDVLARALADSGVTTFPDGADALRAEADAEQVGKIAFAAGVPVIELRPADGAGLEEMFLHLTSETHREGAAA